MKTLIKFAIFILIGLVLYSFYKPSTTSSITSPTPLRIIALDVGQGDAFLIETPKHRHVLIDTGTPKSDTLGLLRQHGVTQLAVLIATHPHADHIGRTTSILNAIPTARFLDSGRTHPSATYERMLTTIKERKIPFTRATRGQEFEIDGVQLQVLNPGKNYIETVGSGRSLENANSVVLRLTYGNFSMLFTGDAEFETEAEMMKASLPLSSTILKVGHHGSRHATSGKFLETVNPSAAIISAGANNEYGHPTPETLKRLKTIPVYRTDTEGQITIVSDGKEWKVQTEKGSQDTSPKRLPRQLTIFIHELSNSLSSAIRQSR